MSEEKSWGDQLVEEFDHIEEEEEPKIYASSLAGYMVAFSARKHRRRQEIIEEM